MKQKRNSIRQLLWIFVVTAMIASFHACDDDDIRGVTTLQYMEIGDVGAGMTFEAKPYFHGGLSEFAITQVKFNGEVKEVSGFSINPESGVITLGSGNTLEPGLYALTISCKINGTGATFEDVLTVNMLAPAPQVFKYKTPLVTFEYGYQDTAYVSEISESVTIQKFLLQKDGDNQYFQIDATTGMITLNPSNKFDEPLPGHYKPTVGILTSAGTQYYPGIIEFNITSKPLGLNYSVAEFQIEQNGADTSVMPTLKGSPDEAIYTLKSVTPATEQIKIEPLTGRIYVEKDNGLGINDYKVDITVANKYGTNEFSGVYTCKVIERIDPIANFSYPATTITRTKSFSIAKDEGFEGTYYEFKLVSISPELTGKIKLDPATGEISAEANNGIPTGGPYSIIVSASNKKGSVEAELKLTIQEHPNYFTITYGNNLGLTPEADYANQFDFAYPKLTDPINFNQSPVLLPVAQASNIKFEILHQQCTDNVNVKDAIKLDPNTGAISLDMTSYNKKAGGVLYALIRASKGSGEEEYIVETPVFIRIASRLDANIVNTLYKPFVLKINPKNGGQSVTPTFESNPADLASTMKLVIDYKDEAQYYDFSGNNSLSGLAATNGTLLNYLWRTYGIQNFSSREPISGIDKFEATKDKKLCYMKQDGSYQVVVNPEIWKDQNDHYAKGAFIARMTYLTNGKDPATDTKNAGAGFPIIIWFDPEF